MNLEPDRVILLEEKTDGEGKTMVSLKTVGPENWRLGLKVAEAQRSFVSDEQRLLARAYAYRESRSRAYVIYQDEIPVGMALYYDCEQQKAFELSQMFIDERYQGKGLGIQAAQEILARMKADGKYDRVLLCYVEGNLAAKAMYEKLGFSPTGQRDGKEIIMEKSLG